MRNFILYTLLFIPLLSAEQTPANDPHWQLVWQDDFNVLDLNKWDVYDWAHGNTVKNNRITMFRANNVVVSSNGNLEIITKNTSVYCPVNPPAIYGAVEKCQNGNYPYSSGWVSSKSSFNTQYGYIEANIKLSHGYGYWPAFWTFQGIGVSNATNSAEIDIFEMLGNLPVNTTTTNIHYTYNPPTPIPDVEMIHTISNFNYSNWNTYAIEWSPSKIIWYVNGRVIRNLSNHKIIDPVRIIFSSVIDPNHLPNQSTLFPLKMSVNYVKVYNLKKDCNNIINACTYDFSTYDNKVKNSITVGDVGCINHLPGGNNTTIRVSSFIKLAGNFNIPLGASFYADAGGECANAIDLKCTQVFNPCLFNFNNYNNQLKKSITLGGGNCSVNISSSNNLVLQATDMITLKEGVTITPQTGKIVVLKIQNCP